MPFLRDFHQPLKPTPKPPVGKSRGRKNSDQYEWGSDNHWVEVFREEGYDERKVPNHCMQEFARGFSRDERVPPDLGGNGHDQNYVRITENQQEKIQATPRA